MKAFLVATIVVGFTYGLHAQPTVNYEEAIALGAKYQKRHLLWRVEFEKTSKFTIKKVPAGRSMMVLTPFGMTALESSRRSLIFEPYTVDEARELNPENQIVVTISVTARGDLYGNGADIERNFGRKTGHMVVRVGEQVVQPSSAPVYGERDFYGPPLTGINYYDGGPVQQALGKRGFTYQFVFDLPREAWSTEVEFVFISRTSSKRWPISIDLNGVR